MLISALTLWLLAAKPPPDVRQDVLDALVLELERSQQRLKLKENASPYFISYQLKDFHSQQLEARYGALFDDRDDHDRKVAVDVRVGSYTFDSAVDDEFDFSMSMKGNSYVAHKNGPLEDDPRALRTALWLITDEKYKLALFNFLKRKGEDVYAVEDPKRPPAFTQEKPVVHLGERLPDQFDHPRWAALSKAISAQLAAVPELFDSEVRITGDHVRRYFVTTEGTRIVTDQTLFGVHLSAFTRAADGQLLDNSRDWYAPTQAQLPTDAAISSAAKVLVDELIALRAAPAIDPYTGPALLEPDAAGVLFHEAVGHRLEGERQNSDQEGKTFRGQVGKVVLPTFLTIVDDPTRAQVGGTPLNGAYAFDEQGVPAQKVTLIENGVLRAYLLSRKPVEGFAQSNGHGRSQGNRKPVARMANLIVESKKTLSEAQLKALLIAEAKRQGKPYGLIIRDITGGNTNTTSFGYQAFKGVPRLVYRVDVNTGKESLVRGVEIVGTPLSSVNRVLATGTTAGVFNGYCGAESGMVPVSTVAPATLLQEIELQRAGEGKDRPPLLPSPFQAPTP